MNCCRVLFFGLAVALMFASCKDYGTFDRPYKVIATGPGPEDIALDTSLAEPRIIVSCSERRSEDTTKNGFYAYTISTGRHIKLNVVGLPADVMLRPHGIDVARVGGETLLYVVNHERDPERHGILVFRLDATEVHFRESLFDASVTSPNDVCTDHRGGIYVSNDSGKRNGNWEKLWALKRSYVMHYNGTSWKQVGDRLAYANGVGVLGERLYVTGTQEKTVHSYRIAADGLSDRKDLPAIKGADNITFNNGKLVTAAHLDFMKFLGHMKDSTDRSPCVVYTVDLVTQKIDTLFMDKGEVLSAASTGLIFGDSLYVAQVFDPFILAIPLIK